VKILLAIDPSEASRKAVEFAGKLLAPSAAKDVTVTLLHVVDSIPEFIVSGVNHPQSGAAYQQVAKDWTSASRAEGDALLSRYRKQLESSGVPASAISLKLVTKEALPEAMKVVAALTIIEEMKSGGFDVVCLGRRGTSAASGSFPGSVAEKVLREAHGLTVWVVD